MEFIKQNLEIKSEFLKELNKHHSFFVPIFDELNKKFYAVYECSYKVRFLKMELDIIKFLNDNCEILSKIAQNIKLCNCEVLTINLCESYDGKNYVKATITNNELCQNDNGSFDIAYSKNNLLLFIKNNYDIFVGIQKNKFHFFELSLGYLSKICNNSYLMLELFNIYFKNIARIHKPLNDIARDFNENYLSIKSPFKFKDLENFINKKHFFEQKYKNYKFLNSTNKHKLITTYIYLKLQKYITKSIEYSFISYLEKLKDYNTFFTKRGLIDTQKVLTKFICNRIKNGYDYYQEFYDYVRMSFEQKQKINFNIKSIKRLQLEHDNLSMKYRLKNTPKIIIKKNNPFLKLKLPKNIKILRNKEELVEESIKNKNCVASYSNYINNGDCFIASLRENNTRYTIEIRKNKNKFYLAQIKGFANSQPSDEIVRYVETAILQNNTAISTNEINRSQ